MPRSSRLRLLLRVCGALAIASATPFFAACSSDATAPTPVSSLTFGQPSPASGATIQTIGATPGAFIPRGSGQLSIPITVTSGRAVPLARLWVYLVRDDGTECGQNLPDTPMWRPFDKGETVSVTITGFQVFRLPCEMASVHAVLHTRDNNGLNTPLTPAETVTEGSLAARYTIR